MLAARIPAFLAAFNATVATGMPLGIWRMDNTESQPSMELEDFMGTPITGNGVREATMPGRCAAPPAPAMITCRPLFLAEEAYSTMRSEEHTSELQSQSNLVCRLLLEKKNSSSSRSIL